MCSKNCPETPRQRMVGMMYLVLTAMLALNVSADVLDAFTQVQESLTSTNSGYKRKNIEIYNEIDMAYSLNETKVRPTRIKALEIKESTEKIVYYIDSLKQRLVELADGAEADVNDIRSKSNLDVGGQLMIVQGRGKVLRKMLDGFRENLLSNVNPKDSVLRASIKSALNTDDPPARDGEFKSWESSKFEHIPLAGVVTMLTMYQTSILSAESDVLRYLVTSIDAESFKFNKLEALVIPESKYIITGDNLKARIMLAAVDTTQKPEIIANGRNVRYEGDFGVYTEPATKVGIYKLKGVINYITPSGQTLPRTFEMDYEVADPAVVISPTKMNVFYVGVDNPVSLAVPGMSADVISAEITNGELIKSGTDYIVRPKQAGKKCEITVYATKNKQKKKLQTKEFRVKEVPDPVAKVAGFKEGSIKRNVLTAAGGISVEMENFDFEMKFTVQSFNMFTVVDGYVQDASSKSASFSAEQLKLIRNLKRNQLLIIEQIVVKGPDGTTRKLSSLSFKID